MADWGEGDELIVPAKKTITKPKEDSWGKDDIKVDVRGFGDKKPIGGILEKSMDDYSEKQEENVSAAGAFGSSYLESVGATPGALVAARAAMAVPQPVWSKPVSGFLGAIIGGYLSSKGITSLEGVVDEVFGTNIVKTREKQKQEYPGYSLAGSVVGGAFSPLMRPGLPDTIKQAALGSGIMVGVGGGMRAVEGQPVGDLMYLAIDAVTGAFTKPTKLGQKVLGQTPAPPKKPIPSGIPPPPPPEGTTPEQVEAFKTKVNKEVDRRVSTSPLVETAIRNKKTGAIERMGPKHDEDRKINTTSTPAPSRDVVVRLYRGEGGGQIGESVAGGEWFTTNINKAKRYGNVSYVDLSQKDLLGVAQGHGSSDTFVLSETLRTKAKPFLEEDTHTQGFLDERGNFLDRHEAADRAVNTGQVTVEGKKPVLEFPEEGLRSGDIRKAGDKRFAITKDQPDLAYPNSDTHPISNDQISLLKDNPWGKTILDKVTATGKSLEDFNAWLVNTLKSTRQVLFDEKHTEVPKELWNQMGKLSPEEWSKKRGYSKEEVDSWYKSRKDIQQGVDEFGLNYDDIAVLVNDPKEHPDYGTMWEKNTHPKQIDLATKTSPTVAKAFEKIDPRSIPNEEEMIKYATDIHERFGEEKAIKFFEDYQKDLNERSIPIPHTIKDLDDAFHKVSTFATKDRSEHTVGYNKTSIGDLGKRPSILNFLERSKWDKEADSRLKEMNKFREAAFLIRENGGKVSGELGKVLDAIDAENIALIRKIKAMGGDVGDEFTTGQSRIRWFNEKEKPGWKETIEEFSSNKMSFGDKVGEQAKAAMDRKVFGLDVWSGLKDSEGKPIKGDGAGAGRSKTDRVIELHRHPKDTKFSYTSSKGNKRTVDLKKGTSIWEWRNEKRTLLGHSDKLDLKRGDTLELKTLFKDANPWGKAFDKTPTSGKEGTGEKHTVKAVYVITDGTVPNIEAHSPYRYWHDAEASARIANMDLRKMARELELFNNLKQSELFKQIAHGPDQDPKTLPSHYVQPENIGLIPQLRGWAFDPKAAAIIDDFAKVWDNTMWMKVTNALIKNMMLNPIPHMFNEVMHLWNARGFTGWVDPRRLGTFASTARAAWRDVGNQTKFYRDVMREGGSILGADPRNNKYFQAIQKEAQKQIFETPEMQRSLGQLAKKLGTTLLDLYNGISNASQKAMWFTRDVMYIQYIREIMVRQEKSTGVRMELEDAIAQAERHMPNYRMPSEVLNSRTIAKILKNPNVDIFSRYHYGMVKSLVNTIKDIDPRNLKTPEGRAHFREGVDSMLAIGVAMAVLYPLMDAMASKMFGEDAEQRRAGPFHLLKAGLDVYEGKKDLSALIWPVFTFNPVLLTLGQLIFNKKIFTGKNIYNIDDSAKDIFSDIGTYAVKQVPQAPPIMSATAEEGGDTKLLARQFDIKVKTEEEKKREERALKTKAQKKKTRDKQRKEGQYNP